MIDLLHILPYQYEDTFYNAFQFTICHLLLKQAIKIDETIRLEHHLSELWIYNVVLLWEL